MSRKSTSVRTVSELLERRLIVCFGTGGVGKTTIAAALGMAGALAGRRAAVITVDPARRLKDALGLEELPDHPHRIPIGGEGCLDALGIDTRRMLDGLIRRVAPSSELAERVLSNRLYRQIADDLAGSTEYVAMEKLHELLHSGRYDLIVVDTPPSAHARDLLSAPVRLTELLATRAVRILQAPASLLAGVESRLARATLRTVLAVLERWTGFSLLEDLSDLASSFEHLADGFRQRAVQVSAALRHPATGFVLVTTGEPDTVTTTRELHQELRAASFPLAGIIANRLHRFPPLPADAGSDVPEPLRRKLHENYGWYRNLCLREEQLLDQLARRTGLSVLAAVARRDPPPVTVEALRSLAEGLLLPPQEEPTTLRGVAS